MNSGKRLRQNIWRIDHLVFAYSTRERLDETRANMNAVLGLEPDDWDDPVVLSLPLNCTTQLCWSAGLELICPAPGDESGEWIGAPLLAERGEGLAMAAFGVPNIREAHQRANDAGFPVIQTFQDPRHPVPAEERPAGEIPWDFPEELQRPHRLIRESIFTPFNGTGLYFAQIEPKTEFSEE
jgi:hypothetical protein